MMKITILGVSGAGKTTFMSGLHESLFLKSTGGFRIQPKHYNDIKTKTEADNKSTKNKPLVSPYQDWAISAGEFDKSSFHTKDGYQFPPGTKRTTEWLFNLYHQDEFICDFSWLDFRGGILTGPSENDFLSDEDKKFQHNFILNRLNESDAVILCVDATILANSDSSSRAKLLSGAALIGHLLMDLLSRNNQLSLTLVIALTKVDGIPSEYKNRDFDQLHSKARDVFDDIISVCFTSNSKWTGCIAAVSATGLETAIKTPNELTSDPNPFNVAEILLHCVADTLEKQREKPSRESTEKIKNLDEQIRKMTRGTDPVSDMIDRLIGNGKYNVQVKKFQSQKDEEVKNLEKANKNTAHIELLRQIAIPSVRVIK